MDANAVIYACYLVNACHVGDKLKCTKLDIRIYCRDATIHNLDVSIYCHLCIMIQQYIARYNQV